MSIVRITIPGAGQTKLDAQNRETLVRLAIDKAISQAGQIVLRRITENLTNRALYTVRGASGRKSGPRLRNSFQARFEPGPPARSTVGTNVVYARIHEFGGTTSPHVIVPVRARALRFFPRAAGVEFRGAAGFVFAKKVNHPGSVIPRRPYVRPALDDSRPQIEANLRRLVTAALKRRGET